MLGGDKVRKMLALTFLLVLIGVIIVPVLIVSKFQETEKPPVVIDTNEQNITVYFHKTDETRLVPLDDYLVGVLAAEMPADFELEALKAQAIAARTYALRRLTLNSANENHPEAVVCTNSNHCQAHLSSEDMKERWGMINYFIHKSKMEEAVYSTKNIVLTYEGRLIEPVYHSTSTGRTENSEDVWLNKIPYLRSVESPGDKESPRFQERKTLTLAEIDSALGTNLQAVPASAMQGTNQNIIRVLENTTTNRVKKLHVDGRTLMGTDIRSALGLNSTQFTWQLQGDRVVFTTTGFGHGVGMSQYGANAMAKAGTNYEQILKHYYTGVELERMEQ